MYLGLEPQCFAEPAGRTGKHKDRVGWNTGRGEGFHSSCPKQLLSPPSFLHLAKQLDVTLGAVDPLSPTPPCLSQTLHNASSHSSSSACDRPGAAERALRVRERGFPGVEEGVLLCSLLTSWGWGGSEFSWSWCSATPPIFQFNRPCGQCCSRTWGKGAGSSWGEPIDCMQPLPRPEGGSSKWLDA